MGIKIIGLGGSLRENSHTYRAVKQALHLAEELGATTSLIDLRLLKLPFCDGRENYPDFPDVAALRSEFQSANAIILATPEYHGSISGVLKNALDLLDISHVEHKVVAIIGVLGGIPSANASNELRTICRHLHAWVIPDQVIISHAEKAFDANGNLVDSELMERLQHMMQSLVQTATRLHAKS